MKRNLITLVLITTAVILQAQESKQIIAGKEWKNNKLQVIDADYGAVKFDPRSVGSDLDRVPDAPVHFLRTGMERPETNALPGNVIGHTTYDVQTNRSNHRRLIVTSSGKIQATWTGSTEVVAGWTDRGTFYNYYDGSAWQTEPAVKISSELERTGWPANGILGTGEEVVIAHSTDNPGRLAMSMRTTLGSGGWTLQNLDDPAVLIGPGTWPRVAIGGPGDSTVHLVYAEYAQEGDPALMRYARSKNAGKTWDTVNVVLPGMAPSDSIYAQMGGDVYAIAAKGDTIAIVGGGTNNPCALWKSTDNGETWAKTVILPMLPLMDGNKLSDPNNDGIADSIPSTDGAVDLAIDNDGKVHVVYGRMFFMDDDTTDGLTSWFPGINGLAYWHENIDTQRVIGVVIDRDRDGSLAGLGSNLPSYGVNISSNGTIAIDDSTGRIYVIFRALVENTDFLDDPSDPTATSFSDLYGVFSEDSGKTWSEQVNLTSSAADLIENAFPYAFDKVIDGKLHVMWQRDEQPGVSVGTAPDHDVAENEIVYHTFVHEDFIGKAPNPAFTCIENFNGDSSKIRFKNESSGEVDFYVWDFGDSSKKDSSTTPTHSYTSTGNFEICLTAENRFGDSTTCNTCRAVYKSPASIENNNLRLLEVYPNPSNGHINIELELIRNSELKIEMLNTVGQTITIIDLGTKTGYQKATLNISDQPKGLYILKITADNAVLTKRIALK